MRRALLSTLLAASCDDAAPPAADSCRLFADGALVRPAAPGSLVVTSVTARYDGGRVHEVSLADLSVRALPLESTGDSVVRAMGEAVALLHRAVGDQDNLTLFARAPDGAARVCQIPLLTDAESRAPGPRPWVNAHDAVALDAGTVAVTRFRLASLAVVDVAAGRVSRSVDLAGLRGAARAVYPDAVARVGPELWVTLGRDVLDQRPTAPGAVARLDARTLEVRGVTELARPNPVGPLHASPDGAQRWVAAVGSYNVVGDGAVEAIDVATGRALDPVVTESEVGGNIDALAVVDERRVVLRVTAERVGGGAIDDLRLVLFDRVARTSTTILRMSTWGAAAPVVTGGRIVAGDPGSGAFREGAGLRFFTRDGAPDGAVVRLGDGLFPYDAQVR
jgi:hypothetical protein